MTYTKRERRGRKLAQGMAVKEIAAELGLSPNSTRPSRQSDGKLGVSNDVELARRMFDGW